jgi:hypothetical protein
MTLFFAVILVIASAFIHYEFLWRLNQMLGRIRLVHARGKVLIAVLGAFVSHFTQITLFACAYYFIQKGGGTELLGSTSTVMDFGTALYFSTETYTSLGFGDIYPVSLVRLIVGVESLTGLIMISWTASFTFLEMNRYWAGKNEQNSPS